jgi:hypothetical protein
MGRTEYSFDLMKNYPMGRRYLIKKPLKTSFLDTLKGLLWSRKDSF